MRAHFTNLNWTEVGRDKHTQTCPGADCPRDGPELAHIATVVMDAGGGDDEGSVQGHADLLGHGSSFIDPVAHVPRGTGTVEHHHGLVGYRHVLGWWGLGIIGLSSTNCWGS